jgi:hypothetical protein
MDTINGLKKREKSNRKISIKLKDGTINKNANE